MSSVVFCYAPEDTDLAQDIGAYLAANLPVSCFYDEGLIRPGFDLLAAVGQGLSAEIVVVLLSPRSAPERWVRDRWEPVLMHQPGEVGSHLLFALTQSCKFPELLRRQSFADLTDSVLEGKRALKRLILSRNHSALRPEDLPAEAVTVEVTAELRSALADEPGFRSGIGRDAALAFARLLTDEFAGAFWIDCSGRTQAGILGDTAQALGLRLSGSVEQNAAALRQFCGRMRCLFVYENLAPCDIDLVRFGGLSSVIVTGAAVSRPALGLDATQRLFAAWTSDPARCLRFAGDAYQHVCQGAAQLGWSALALLKHYDRLAEAHEFLEAMLKTADADATHRLEWERSWILGHWGEPYSASVLPLIPPAQTVQLGFEFA